MLVDDRTEAIDLRRRIEDHMIGVTERFPKRRFVECWAIGMDLLPELFRSESRFVGSACSYALEVLANERKGRPRREAFECEQNLAPSCSLGMRQQLQIAL